MTRDGDRGNRVGWCAPGYENAEIPEREPQVWTDPNGNEGSQYHQVRTLVTTQGYVQVAFDREERVEVPAGSRATVLYVNSETRIVGVEFHDEGNAFGNLAWDAVEIMNDRQS